MSKTNNPGHCRCCAQQKWLQLCQIYVLSSMKTGTPVCGKNAAYKKETVYDFMKIPHDVHDIKPGKGVKPQKKSLQGNMLTVNYF